MKTLRTFVAFDILLAALLALTPFFFAKGKYPLLTVACLLLALAWAAAGAGLWRRYRRADMCNRWAAYATLAVGASVLLLLVLGATYIVGIYGVLGQVISGVLWMAALVAANLFFLYPLLLLSWLKRREPAAA